MILSKVTITGADHTVKVSDLVEISEEYPYVEWGILFSQDKQGCEYRYPREEWLEELRTQKLNNLSAHLCGQWVKDITEVRGYDQFMGRFSFVHYLDGIYRIFRRMQLNMTDDRFATLMYEEIRFILMGVPTVIIQTKRLFETLTKSYIGSDMSYNNKKSLTTQFAFLYDASGGKGQLPRTWSKPLHKIPCGLAGGLNPSNLRDQLYYMNDFVSDNTIWIDMESGVRTDNKFDLKKVRQCLEIAKPYVHS